MAPFIVGTSACKGARHSLHVVVMRWVSGASWGFKWYHDKIMVHMGVRRGSKGEELLPHWILSILPKWNILT